MFSEELSQCSTNLPINQLKDDPLATDLLPRSFRKKNWSSWQVSGGQIIRLRDSADSQMSWRRIRRAKYLWRERRLESNREKWNKIIRLDVIQLKSEGRNYEVTRTSNVRNCNSVKQEHTFGFGCK